MTGVFESANRWARPDRFPLIGALASAIMLAGAFAFEIIGQYPPCPLCIEQRWAHVYILVFGVSAYIGLSIFKSANAIINRLATAMTGLLFAFSAWRAGYHAGGEYKLWPLNCQAGDVSGVTVDDLLSALNTPTHVILCDEPAWALLGVSMAGYNALFSALMCTICIWVMFRTPNGSGE